MSYLKRQKAPKNWPIERKGTTYVVGSNFNPEKGVPVLIILRDILKIAQNRRDVKKIIHAKQALLNNKPIKDEKNNLLLFDILNVIPTNKFYQMGLSNKGKFKIKEIDKKDSGKKIAKIINKKMIKGKKIQLNLSDGTNFLSDVKCNVKDSVLIDFAKREIETIIPLQEKAKTIVLEGKHAGETGVIHKIKDKTAEVKIEDKNVEILIKQLMAIK